jgi:hypothetical protein
MRRAAVASIIGTVLSLVVLAAPAAAQVRVGVPAPPVLVTRRAPPAYVPYDRSWSGDRAREQAKRDREYREDVREASRKYEKDRREAERKYWKNMREARRKYEKDRREAEREYWKKVREAQREYAKDGREARRNRGW